MTVRYCTCGHPEGDHRLSRGPLTATAGLCLIAGCDCVEYAPVRQRQDSLDAQLRDVRAMANRMGCYDAADWIRARTLYEDAA
jgi:hypothetical protein